MSGIAKKRTHTYRVLEARPDGQPAAPAERSAPHAAASGETILVIGNGMACHRLCDRLTREGHKRAVPKVIVLGEENRPAYDRVRLGEMLKGRRATSLALATSTWYAERGIELVLDDPVVSIDREARVARTRSNRAVSYDRLVFATGAAAVVPRIDIDARSEIFLIRTTHDCERVRERAANGAKTAVVMGGGLLGLETAKSLQDAGLEVTVIEAAPHLMARQLDEEAAAVLKKKLESTGMHVVLGAQVARIAPADGSTSEGSPTATRQELTFAAQLNHPPLAADIVVISVGVKPRDELAQAAGLLRGKRGGIAVDKHLRTSDPHIFAIGDCAAFQDTTFGLVAPGYRMADAVAATLLGTPTVFQIAVAPVTLKVAGVDVVTIGETQHRPRHRTYRYRHNSVYRRIVVEDGHFVGATSVGAWPELAAVQEAIADERNITQGWFDRFLKGEPLFREGPLVRPRADDEIVCACANVTAGTIRKAIAGGCKTADEVSACTGASRGCGSCLPLVSLMVGKPAPARRAARRSMVGFGAVALAGMALALVASPVKLAGVLDRVGMDRLFRDPFVQQVSGFTLLGMCALAMLLPLAKRAFKVSGSALPLWRAVHGGVGLAALGALVTHTTLRTGHHMNLALECTFALLLVLGAGAGLFALNQTSRAARWLRLAHLVVFWPLLSLLSLHVLAVYYF